MITTILAWTGIGFVHLVIGTYIGKWSLKVWENGKENFSSFILFPFNTVLENVGNDTSVLTFVTEVSDEDYNKTMAFLWSAKLAWNVGFMIPAICAIFTGVKIFSFLGNMAGRVAGVAAQPVVALEKLSANRLAKKLEKAKQLSMQTVPPYMFGYTRADIETQMEEQRRIVDAATSQAENAKKEYKRLNKIHSSTWSRG